MSFCPKNRLLFCCEFLQLLFQAANVPHPFLATGSGRAHKSLKHTNHDLEAVLASGSMTKCEPTWYHHHVKFWDVFGPNQNRNRQKWKPPSSPFLSTQDLDLFFGTELQWWSNCRCSPHPNVASVHRAHTSGPLTVSTADSTESFPKPNASPRYMIRMCRDSGAPNHSGFL